MQLKATPEQAARLTELLEAWEAQLGRLETRPDLQSAPLLTQSRRVLGNYRRTLGRDLARGLGRVPATELLRAVSTAQAFIKQLDTLESSAE